MMNQWPRPYGYGTFKAIKGRKRLGLFKTESRSYSGIKVARTISIWKKTITQLNSGTRNLGEVEILKSQSH